MNHPLTDEMCEILSRQPWLGFDSPIEGTIHDMRAAYDKGGDERLEQVIEWLKDYPVLDILEAHGIEAVVEELKKEMRPQEES